MSPFFSASTIMLSPIRSFTLRHGSSVSSLAAIRAPTPLPTLFRYTMGVLPIRSVTDVAILGNAAVGCGASTGGAAAAAAEQRTVTGLQTSGGGRAARGAGLGPTLGA